MGSLRELSPFSRPSSEMVMSKSFFLPQDLLPSDVLIRNDVPGSKSFLGA